MKKVLSVLFAFVLILGSGPGVLAAETRPTAEFVASKVDKQENFTVTLALKDMSFRVFQFSLSFDPSEMILVDSSGKASEDPEDYQENLSNGWLNEMGCQADNSKGFLGFTGFILSSQKDKRINEDNCMVVGNGGVEVFRFRFKRVGPIKTGLTISEEGSTGIANAEGDLDFHLSFTLPDNVKTELTPEQIKDVQEGDSENPSEVTTDLSRNERIKDTVVMQSGNSAAVVEGKRQVIYPNEAEVYPYEENGVWYIPLRFVAEQLGATVTWNGKNRTVTVKKGSTTAVITIGSKEFLVNGKRRVAKQTAMIKNSRTMVSSDLLESVLNVGLTLDSGLLVFTPKDSPWNSSNEVEKKLIQDICLLLSPFVGMFAGIK